MFVAWYCDTASINVKWDEMTVMMITYGLALSQILIGKLNISSNNNTK